MEKVTQFRPFSQIIGQDRAVGFIKKVIEGEKIPHAYLFTGIAGVGKRTTALAFTQAINCQNPRSGEGCGNCLPCRQIIGGNFPDLHSIEPEGQVIKIEQIRTLIRSLGFKNVSARYRVSILREAEKMTPEASNAFLKTLEEPPFGNILILTVAEQSDLLPTIVSRCQKVPFRPIPVPSIVDWLKREMHVGEEKARILAKLSEGSLGSAVKMLNNDIMENRQEHLFQMVSISDLRPEQTLQVALDYAARGRKGRDSGGNGMSLSDILGIWKTWYRDMLIIRVAGSEDLLINMDLSHQLKKMAKRFRIKDLIESFQALDLAQKDILKSRNLDLLMENTFLKLNRIAGRMKALKTGGLDHPSD